MKKMITCKKDTEYNISERIDYIRDLLDDALDIDYTKVPEDELSQIRKVLDNMYDEATKIKHAIKSIREDK